MIELSDQDVAEFQDLYLRQTGRRITDKQARRYAEALVDLVDRIVPHGNGRSALSGDAP